MRCPKTPIHLPLERVIDFIPKGPILTTCGISPLLAASYLRPNTLLKER